MIIGISLFLAVFFFFNFQRFELKERG